MDDGSEGLIQESTEAGIAADHPPTPLPPLLLAPATEKQANTLRPPLRPIACWAIGDERFELGSSFVAPQIAEDLSVLASLVERLEKKHGARPVAAVFGHADPVGKEDLNKKLSGRRAAAVYALLTRRADIWEDIYSQTGSFTSPLEDDTWGEPVLRTLLTDLGYGPVPASGRTTEELIRSFQADQGLNVDGKAGADTRAKLFLQYMAKHGRNRAGDPFSLTPDNFIAGGADPGGKGDVQGCSEFNPLRILSEEENENLNGTERDAANAANRRVAVFLFAPAMRLAPDAWPCPRVSEGVSDCRSRFWSDAQARRQPGAARRQRPATLDTFACRFYERLAGWSPCERVFEVSLISIRLFDICRRPLPGVSHRITIGKRTFEGVADDRGFATVRVRGLPRVCLVEWNDASGNADPPYRYRRCIYLDVAAGNDDPVCIKRRFSNLGYAVRMETELTDQPLLIREFKEDCQYLGEGPDFDSEAQCELRTIHDECRPAPRREPEQEGVALRHPAGSPG